MQLYLNNWSSSLALPVTAASTQLAVAPADAVLLTGLGAGDHYLLTLTLLAASGGETAWEIVRVTAQASGVLDVLRGQEGTTALAWEAGVPISARLTRGSMEALRDSVTPSLSDAPAQPLGTAEAGVSADASRADHVHEIPSAADVGAAPAAHAGAGGSAHAEAVAGGDSGFMTGAQAAKLAGIADGATAAAPVITEATTARTLALTDAGAYIRHTNASASTVTVAAQSSVAWLANTEIYLRRAAAGGLTLTPGAGVTLNAPSGGTLVMTAAMSATLKRVDTDVWDVIGQTAAV